MQLPKVHRADNGSKLVVAAGGKIEVQVGGEIDMEGEIVASVTFDPDYFTVTEGLVSLKAEVVDLLEIVAGIPTTDPEQVGEVWLDGTTLKVSEGD